MSLTDRRIPRIVHVIYRLDIGGLETVLVEFVNRCPADMYRHVILCLTESTSFRERIKNNNVEVIELHKKSGKDVRIFFKILRLFSALKPFVVHTYNIACLEYQIAAKLTGVPIRIHAEHGRENSDLFGTNTKYNVFRKIMDFVVHYWIPVSKDLERWLIEIVRIPPKKIQLIHNGVDTSAFLPLRNSQKEQKKYFIIGTVGRLDPVKDHKSLISAVSEIEQRHEHFRGKIKLQIIGDGQERVSLERLVKELSLENVVEFLGARNDVRELLNTFDLFCLSSKAEGIPMTILEAYSCQCPVVATNVGGIPEIIGENGDIGLLVAPGDPSKIADAIVKYIENPGLAISHGKKGRERMITNFSLDKMTSAYMTLYKGEAGSKI